MKLVIYGIGDFAELMSYYFTSDSDYEVVAFCADDKYINNNELNGKPIVSFDEVQKIFPPSEYEIFIAVGYKSMRSRMAMYLSAKAKGYKCASYISSKSISDCSNTVGENCAILHAVILEPFSEVHNNCCINTGAIICHHAVVEEGCFLAAKSIIGGFTRIKKNSFIGFSATVLQKVIISSETLVGANSLIISSTCECSKYLGTPAKKVSEHSQNGIEVLD